MACSEESLEAADDSVYGRFKVLDISFVVLKYIGHQGLHYVGIALSINSRDIKKLG